MIEEPQEVIVRDPEVARISIHMPLECSKDSEDKVFRMLSADKYCIALWDIFQKCRSIRKHDDTIYEEATNLKNKIDELNPRCKVEIIDLIEKYQYKIWEHFEDKLEEIQDIINNTNYEDYWQ